MSSDGIPVFPKLDVASPAFWDARFDAAFTPWDQGGIPQALVNYVTQNPEAKKVLIPGCGTAYELRFFAHVGWDATAIDFSPVAVARAKQMLGTLGANIRVEDFFGAPLSQQRFDVIYERAFLCALPQRLWSAWAERVSELLLPGGRLIGFFFFDTGAKGPPFGAAPAELAELLSPHFDLIEDALPSDSISVFAGKERWQVWLRRT